MKFFFSIKTIRCVFAWSKQYGFFVELFRLEGLLIQFLLLSKSCRRPNVLRSEDIMRYPRVRTDINSTYKRKYLHF
jgi:hypothetical protein